ncbi:EAL domain-containing protein (putative c-di-GMP-specific phosphodiesterase class I) [Planomicrobium soli]|uniref:EAL domain-containing protein (Putative c-di-GMP-specific phosphodiesterase class I) n=1 Tax=Planomicrobium soli TaxID=1176648 RepID=A0A2P8H5A6_9BACL|nr:EAL domain-containing protein [Planomicrobium soli]PSL41398.1 EAL domain-containing protein (putative c-di-GMP-specific phosphodiesterase class I) [Planomicrobium soli]
MQPDLLFTRTANPLWYFSYLLRKRRKNLLEYKQMKELQLILRTKSVETYFQPLVALNTGNTVGYEVFNRPVASSLFPTTETFYDFVGQTDLIFSLENTFREISLSRFSKCVQLQPSEKAALLFLNVHPHILMDPHYRTGETLKMLKGHGFSPEQIIFEISEKAAIENYSHFENILTNYRSQGFRIALDDAGSGYNSLKTLVYLKPEFLKLDKTVIQNIDQDQTKQQLVKLLLNFSNESNTHLIAEGIEREEELLYLKQHGIHIGQGYALGKPKQELVKGVMR